MIVRFIQVWLRYARQIKRIPGVAKLNDQATRPWRKRKGDQDAALKFARVSVINNVRMVA